MAILKTARGIQVQIHVTFEVFRIKPRIARGQKRQRDNGNKYRCQLKEVKVWERELLSEEKEVGVG